MNNKNEYRKCKKDVQKRFIYCMNKRIAEKIKGEKAAEMVARGKEEDEKKKKAAV